MKKRNTQKWKRQNQIFILFLNNHNYSLMAYVLVYLLNASTFHIQPSDWILPLSFLIPQWISCVSFYHRNHEKNNNLLLQRYNVIEKNVARPNVGTLNDLAHGMSEKCGCVFLKIFKYSCALWISCNIPYYLGTKFGKHGIK